MKYRFYCILFFHKIKSVSVFLENCNREVLFMDGNHCIISNRTALPEQAGQGIIAVFPVQTL